ncbi:MAG: YdeI/OmpD-associated family protein [Bacteroidia bacterium]|nr:YdeI/OmpD-associated family protein [Bacteroidia bacterium]
MTPVFFNNQLEFRKWLENNHEKEKELLVGYYKVGSGKQNMTWSESVDQAICYGWIDGVRKSIDKNSYCIRFTPRKPKSNWSEINIKKVEELTKQGLMHPSGIAIFNIRLQNHSGVYSYENRPEILSDDFEKIFKANKKAWSFFELQSSSYKKTFSHWVMSAKQESTKINRLNKLIKQSELKQKLF